MAKWQAMNWFALLLTFALTSCGKNPWGITAPTQYSLDGVKRIAPSLAGDNSTSWGQATYIIDSTSRLLLRFEKLSEHTGIVTTGGKKVAILLTLNSASSVSAALSDLKLCPITKNWMMLASWTLTHPFMGGESWASAGGDYDSSGCKFPTLSSGTTATLEFDMTDWYSNYPKGRGQNYGVIAISTQSFDLVGETSGSYSPRITFEE